MKRVAILLAAILFLPACGTDRAGDRAERLQKKFDSAYTCTAVLNVQIIREDETLGYTLDVSHSPEKTDCTVLKPEELSGVHAIAENSDALKLEYDGFVLDADSLDPQISGVSAAPLFFRALEDGYVLERSMERLTDTDNALRLSLELELDGKPLRVAAWFDKQDTPLYAEMERDGKIVAYLEFTDFNFGAILDE